MIAGKKFVAFCNDFMHDKNMPNLQVRISPEMEAQMERLALKSRSAFVREAIMEKIKRETFRRMEEAWINALRKKPDVNKEDEDWFLAQAWGEK